MQTDLGISYKGQLAQKKRHPMRLGKDFKTTTEIKKNPNPVNKEIPQSHFTKSHLPKQFIEQYKRDEVRSLPGKR